MTFASKKRNINLSVEKRKTPLSSLSQSRAFTTKNTFTNTKSNYGLTDIINEPPAARLEKIENNLSKLISQNDILLPLLNMTSSISIFAKNNNEIKDFQKKLADHEKNIGYFEEGFAKCKEYLEEAKYNLDTLLDEKLIDTEQLEKQLKLTNNHLNALHSNLKDVENTVVNLQNIMDKKFHEHTKNIKDTVETKMKKKKKDIQQYLKESENRINDIFKTNEENLKKYDFFKVFNF